jgi:hypothetical protein
MSGGSERESPPGAACGLSSFGLANQLTSSTILAIQAVQEQTYVWEIRLIVPLRAKRLFSSEGFHLS